MKIANDIKMGGNRDCGQNFDIFHMFLSGHIAPLLCVCVLEDARSTADVLQEFES